MNYNRSVCRPRLMFADHFWDGCRMTSQSQEFAKAVLAGFVAAGLHTDVEIGAAGGPSTTTMTQLRKVARGEEEMAQPRNPTWRRIDTAAGWPAGAARALWEGTPPPSSGLGHLSVALHGVDSAEAVLAFDEWAKPFFEVPIGEPDWLNPPKAALALYTDEHLLEELRYRLRLYRDLSDTYFDDLQEVDDASGPATTQAGESPAQPVPLNERRTRRGRSDAAVSDAEPTVPLDKVAMDDPDLLLERQAQMEGP